MPNHAPNSSAFVSARQTRARDAWSTIVFSMRSVTATVIYNLQVAYYGSPDQKCNHLVARRQSVSFAASEWYFVWRAKDWKGWKGGREEGRREEGRSVTHL